MAHYKPYSYDQTKLIALSFQDQIVPGTFEYALNYIVDNELDLDVFAPHYQNDETGAPAYNPAILLKIVLYAYSRGITSSRAIAAACSENVIFMALSADTQPHFTTIAHFISSMHDQIVPLFRDVLAMCYTEGLIGKTMFAIDGCKISSNCSKEWSGTRRDFEKKREKLERSIRFLVAKHKEEDKRAGDGTIREKERAAVTHLKERVKKINAWLLNNKDKVGSRGTIKQSNMTDNESAKMPTSHGVVQGYIGSAAVDAKRQVIVHAEAFGDNHEQDILKPMVEGIEENISAAKIDTDVFSKAKLVADTGYHSEENVRMAYEKHIDAYIPDTRFRKRDERFSDADTHRTSPGRDKAKYFHKQFHAADFVPDTASKTLRCPGGCVLTVANPRFRNTSGLIGTMYVARKEDCAQCAYRDKCLSGNKLGPRRVTFFRKRAADAPLTFSQRMIRKIDTMRGRYYYSRRLGIIEPVFGNIRNALGLTWFSLRGKRKVDIQWKLFSMVHNIGKIWRYGLSFA